MFFRLVSLSTAIGLVITGCDTATGPTPADAPQQTATLVSGVHLDAIDRATRPQDDFYQFANGAWLDNTEIPDIYSGYTVYHEVREDVEAALRSIIEDAAANPGEEGTESQQVGDLYGSWMDEATINAAGIGPVSDVLAQIDAVDSVAGLARVMAELHRGGVTVLYKTLIYPDLKNSDEYAFYIEQAGITMPNRDYYIDLDNERFATARNELRPYIASLLERTGVAADVAAEAADEIYGLEAALAEAHWDAVTNRDMARIYNPYPIGDLAELGANFDWAATLEVLGVDGEEKIIVEQPSFFETMDRLLAEVPLETWKHYLAFRVLDSRGLHLDAETAAIRFDYQRRVLLGQQEEQPRWKLGVAIVNLLVGEAAGKLYVAEYFPAESKAKVEALVDNVIATFDDSLQDLEWMTPETRAQARDKLAKFTAKIGYPDEWRDYSTLDIVAGDHIGNLRRAMRWEFARQVAKLGTPVDNKEWRMTPQTVNAYYSPALNEIVFPAARLQPPLFQPDADDAINYGTVGGVIGHEISHGFDDKGSTFNGDGNMVNWWADEDRAAFEERTTALVAQFEEFEPVEGMSINGELTLGENIGDLSGVAMAYRAYIRSLGGKEPPVIDGFTGPQRFFIGYAMSRKGKYYEASEVRRLASDPHSPLKYRVIGPYRNIDAFHEAFGTQPGDGMWLPPEERVRIW